MLRKQIAALVLAACLAVTSGCSTVSEWTSSLFRRPVVCSPECDMGTGSCCGGAAMMEEAGPYLGAPPEAGLPPMGSGSCVAPNVPQRIVPQPAQPDPYTPTTGRPRLLSAFQK